MGYENMSSPSMKGLLRVSAIEKAHVPWRSQASCPKGSCLETQTGTSSGLVDRHIGRHLEEEQIRKLRQVASTWWVRQSVRC